MVTDKKTLGIMTSEESFHNNYGAVLQGYALSKIIKELGHEPFVIRYQYIGKKRKYAFIKDLVKFIIANKQEKKIKIRMLANKHMSNSRKELFLKFQNDEIKFYNTKKTNWREIEHNCPPFDMFLCGSDQIWNPVFKNNSNDRGYFLDFVPAGKKRIAYAPSIGTNIVPLSCRDEMIELINKMDYISIRELQGARIIKELTGKDVPVLLDPTLLLNRNEWEKIAECPKGLPDKYILVYRFKHDSELKNVIEIISMRYSLPIVSVVLSEVSYGDEYLNRFDIGPREFIGVIKSATLVCTDSFHATIFSYLMNTPFLVFGREAIGNDGANMNARITDLLKILRLTDRYVHTEKDINYATLFDADYVTTDKIVATKKLEAMKYLIEAIG